MLTIAGLLFVLAILLWCFDKLIDHADVDLSWPVRILLIASAVLISLDLFVK